MTCYFVRRLVAASLVLDSVGSSARADYATAVLADGPIGYWRMNEPTGDVAADLGSDGNEGEYFGGQRVPMESFTLVDGRQVQLGAGNLAFQIGEDIDEYMQVIDPIMSDLEQFTMSAWINPGPRDANRIGLMGQNDAIEFGFIAPNQIQMWTPSGQVLNYNIDPVNEVPEDTWFHLATVGTGTAINLFINGEPVVLNEGPPLYGRSNFPFNIGGGGVYDAAGNQFTGSVDEVAVFTSALSEGQIQAHVTAAKAVDGDYAASVLADGPVGYWGFNGGGVATNQGSGGAALNGTYVGGDNSVAGANEAFPGVQGVTGFAGEAPDDGYVTVESSILSGLGEFTLSGFIKPGAILDNRVGLFGQNDAIEFGFIDPTTIQLWTPGGGAVNYALVDEVIEDEWVHIAAVGDGDELRLYIDGEEVTVGGAPVVDPVGVDSYGASEFPFSVGGGGVFDNAGNQFTGMIDEVAVWHTALTPAQIAAHFQAALADTDPLAPLDDGTLTDPQERADYVRDVLGTWVGDSNLDGEFNSGDFVAVFTAGEYEDTLVGNSSWRTGDWNGDGEFTSSDFVTAFTDGGYERGPRAAVAAVPEPSALVLLAIGGLLIVHRRR